MIVVTGGAGFIGSNLVEKLVALKHDNIVVVDNNLDRPKFDGVRYMSIEDSYLLLNYNAHSINHIIHLGARTDTMEQDEDVFDVFNLKYSKFIWGLCSNSNIPLIYASSGAVYGEGKHGFNEDTEPNSLKPMNPYGKSKLDFDEWAMEQEEQPSFWQGLRFFNVYGPKEKHKSKMASVVLHFYNQVKETGKISLFRSHRLDYGDGEQERDFIYVNDIIKTILWFYAHEVECGIYNLGTGVARTYNDLAKSVFKSLGVAENIDYIETPLEIRNSYQYHTKANVDKLNSVSNGMVDDFISLEDGINTYINILKNEDR